MAKPLVDTIVTIRRVEEGNLETGVPVLSRKAIGSLAFALANFREQLIVRREQGRELEELRSAIEAASAKAMLGMCEMLEADLESAMGEEFAAVS